MPIIKVVLINIKKYIMPNFDQTGPNGNGPLTGRGLGKCQGNKGARMWGRFRQCCPFWGRNQKTDKELIEQEIEDTKNYLKDLESEKENIDKE